MKILNIEVENYRLIRAMLLDLDGKNLALAGETGQGKTTAISLLWESLKTVGDPVTHGEKRGQIKITLGDGETEVFVTRSFTSKTAPITIMTSKGDRVSASEFASWFCDLGDNPQRILRMKPLEQAEALLGAVKLPDGVVLADMDAKREKAAKERLELQRDGKRDAERLGAEPPKAERVDLDALIKEEDAANEINRKREQAGGEKTIAEADLVHANQRVEEAVRNVEEQAEALRRAQETLDQANTSEFDAGAKAATLTKELQSMHLVDVGDIRSRLQQAREVNATVNHWDGWKLREKELEELRAQYKAKDAEVKALDKAKKDALAKAEWPLDGLSIEEGVIHYNDTPLSQCGHSEQMLVTGALSAATISRHKLHVVRMDGIESMSKKDFAQLEEIFTRHEIQVLSSRVTRGAVDADELLIVDGAIQKTN